MSLFDRVSLQDLKDGEDVDFMGKIDVVAADGSGKATVVGISQAIDTKERSNSSGDEKNRPSAIGSGKTSGGLRRSQSDAADSSTSLDEKALAADEVEISLPTDKHRGSYVSALKPTGSPILKRRQTALDSAFHNLLQEGKDFLHRKRQQVPIFGSHFANKTDLLASSSLMAASDLSNHSGDSHSSALGTIVYRRKNDSISLDYSEGNEPEAEKVIVKIHSLPPMEDGNQLKDTAEDLSHVANGAGNFAIPSPEKFPPALAKSSPTPSKRSGSISSKSNLANCSGNGSRPTSLSPSAVDEIEKTQDSPRLREENSIISSVLEPMTSQETASKSSSPVWKYYKEIIGAVLVALTLGQFIIGYRSFPVFLLGLLWGIYLTFRVATIIFWFCLPADRYPSFTREVEPPPNNERVLASIINEEELLAEDPIVYKGWMNRLPTKYDPDTYHINLTHSVLVRLDRNILRLSTPRVNLGRHAYCREQRMNPAFISQEMHDMKGACVFLRPKNLAHRRWWSRKYPISIVFPPKAVNDKGRRDSTPVTHFPTLDEKTASDTSYNSEVETKEPMAEVAMDALMEGVRGHGGDQLTEEESVVETDEDEDEQSSFHSTMSLPSNLGSLTRKEQRKDSRKRRRKRRVINLFGRSAREKENWFYRLRQAACHYSYAERREDIRQYAQQNQQTGSDGDRPDNMPPVGVPFFRDLSITAERNDFLKKDDPLSTEWILFISMHKQYQKHMESYMPEERPKLEMQTMDLISLMWKTWMGSEADASTPGEMSDPRIDTPSIPMPLPGMSIDWANAFGSRLFYDFTRNPKCMGNIQERIQRKLATLHLPYFIEMLTLSQLEPGTTAPRIIAVNDPSINEWGLWVDVKMEYPGGLRLVLETKVNLIKLTAESGPLKAVHEAVKDKVANYTNNEFPESPETSPDEDETPSEIRHKERHHHKDHKPGQESKGKKILNFVDKIAHSKPFQAAAENKYVKKMIQGVSETPLVLEVEVVYLCGALCVNIPPPPSDRLWWGFRFPPKVVLKARPRVGERVVNLSHITDWIENKLVMLVEKNLVIPNLDDLIVPIMGGSPLYRNFNR